MSKRPVKVGKFVGSVWVVCRRSITANKWLEYGLVGLALLVLAIIITGGVIFHASTQLFTDGIGDATSGFTWILFAQNHLPLFSQYSHLLNYPYGDNLISPQYVTSAIIYGPLYILARIFSALTAMNIMTLVGFVSCGLAMYVLIKKLTGKWYLALLAAYPAAFMPYHLVNATTHNTNVFSWVFIAIIGTFIAFWRRQTLKRGLLLGLSIAAAGYTDGYFIFIGSVLLAALVISVITVDLFTGTRVKVILGKIRGLVLAALAAILLLLPVGITQLSSGGKIQQQLSGLRSNIKVEVATYSVEPIDFLLPGQGNVLVGKSAWYQHYYGVKNSHSNNVENTNYIGYTILALFMGAFLYSLLLVRHTRLSKKNKELTGSDYVMAVCVVAAPLALIWMLPPMLFNTKMPIGYLTDYVAYWRVPARIFLALQPLLVIAGVLALNKFICKQQLGKKAAVGLVAIILCLVALEYNMNIYRPAFGFKDMPYTYTWLASQKDVHSVAEVPLVDRPVEIAGYYLFAQIISGKPIVNNPLSRLPIGQYNTLGDLSNPETINFIRSRGADVVIDHTTSCKSYDWGVLVHQERNVLSPPFMDKVGNTLCVYKLTKAQPQDPYFAYAASGFQTIDYRDKNVRYWLILDNNHPTLRVVDNQGRAITHHDIASFSAELSFVGDAPEKILNWTVAQNGKTVASGTGVKDVNISAEIDTAQPVNISVTTDSFNRVPLPGEIDMRGVQITK